MEAYSRGDISLDTLCEWSDNPDCARNLLTLTLEKQIGVFKSRELLENPEEDDQQPSQAGMLERFND